ncbi:MAG: PspC domain-containing protein [Planctomycetales bacterium]|nr:PspC domain-containing protein [bacterium]UNM08389.1 MAG: PspC domain-containing protein [Planctomycetales bacterium]
MQRTDRVLRVPRGKGGVLLGLCAGMGNHLGIDPVVIRFILLALMFLTIGGLAVPLIYLLFSLFVPVDNG